MENNNVSDKSRLAVTLLSIPSVLGLGLHDFYAGRIGRGFTKLIPIYGPVSSLVDTFNALGGGYVDAEGKKVKNWF